MSHYGPWPHISLTRLAFLDLSFEDWSNLTFTMFWHLLFSYNLFKKSLLSIQNCILSLLISVESILSLTVITLEMVWFASWSVVLSTQLGFYSSLCVLVGGFDCIVSTECFFVRSWVSLWYFQCNVHRTQQRYFEECWYPTTVPIDLHWHTIEVNVHCCCLVTNIFKLQYLISSSWETYEAVSWHPWHVGEDLSICGCNWDYAAVGIVEASVGHSLFILYWHGGDSYIYMCRHWVWDTGLKQVSMLQFPSKYTVAHLEKAFL